MGREVAAALLLQRSGGRTRLEPAAPSQLVCMLAESAAAPGLDTAAALAAAMGHVRLPVQRLIYGEAAEAAPFLRAQFGS